MPGYPTAIATYRAQPTAILTKGHPSLAREVTGRGVLSGAHGRPQGPERVYALDGWRKMSHPQRIAVLRQLAEEHARDPRMAVFTTGILQGAGVPPRDGPGAAAALLRFVQDNIYYANEPDERLQSPWRTLEWKTGDCDDEALLLSTLAGSIALPNRFVLIGRLRSNGKLVRWVEGTPMPSGWRTGKSVDWFHVYLAMGWPFGAAVQDQHWAEAEPTLRGAPLGYSLLRHGIVSDAHGRLTLPKGLGSAVPGGPDLSLTWYRGLPPNGGGGGGATSAARGAFYGALTVPSDMAGVPAPGLAVKDDLAAANEERDREHREGILWKAAGIAAEAAVGAVAAFLAVGAAERWQEARAAGNRGGRRAARRRGGE